MILLSRWWYILHYHRSTLLLPLRGEVVAVDGRVEERSDDQLPILAVLGSAPIPYCTYSAPTFGIPNWSTIGLPVHTPCTPQSPSYLAFSLLSTLCPTNPLLLPGSTTPPPDYLGTDQLSTNICYPSTPSYNDHGHH